MLKRALLVGINNYDNVPALLSCVDDASAMAEKLRRHEDGALNYDCEVLTSDKSRVDEEDLRSSVQRLFSEGAGDDVVFFFSGHGVVADDGGYLVTQDSSAEDQGYPMAELLQAANGSGVGSALLILDCCHSGSIGGGADQRYKQVTLSEGVTVLAASSAQQQSQQGLENSLFTALVLDALDGGAADIRGRVSAAAIYGYVEQALGAWQQRPIYKSHARQLNPIRQCDPAVSDRLLRELNTIFPSPHMQIEMDPSFEFTDKAASPDKVELFDKFKSLRNARLLRTTKGEDLYFAALNSGSVELTSLGRFYWQLVATNRI